jgi:hypothetical protein
MGHKLLVEVTVDYRGGWYYPLYRAFGVARWSNVIRHDGGIASFRDEREASRFLKLACDEFVRDGFYCQVVEVV